jgi:ribosomal protein S12 methylthiotransferase accessory factor
VLRIAGNFRSGMVLPVQEVLGSQSDFTEIFNYSVAADSSKTWNSAAGSIAWNREAAADGAIGEALERYAASVANMETKFLADLKTQKVILPDQFAWFSDQQYYQKNFSWKKLPAEKLSYAEVFSIYNNNPAWLPDFALTLGSQSKFHLPSTSTGLAAHGSFYQALLSALEEVLERDALACYWLNSLPGRSIPIPKKYQTLVDEKEGQIFAFDLSQAWNPLSVIAVCGFLPSRGKKRISLGVACRPSREQALDKAFLEFAQGCIFAGHYTASNVAPEKLQPKQVTTFDLHAAYYTFRPDQWEETPLIKKSFTYQGQLKNNFDSTEPQIILQQVLPELKKAGLSLYYRQLEPVDVKQAGVYVVRVVSPEMSLIHGDENIPFLGGRVQDVIWRFPDLVNKTGIFPNPFPHPLG